MKKEDEEENTDSKEKVKKEIKSKGLVSSTVQFDEPP